MERMTILLREHFTLALRYVSSRYEESALTLSVFSSELEINFTK